MDLKLFTYPPSAEKGIAIATAMNLFGITISTDHITLQDIAAAHQQNIRVALWGCKNEKDNQEAIQKSSDFIQTDKPIHLLKLLGRNKR